MAGGNSRQGQKYNIDLSKPSSYTGQMIDGSVYFLNFPFGKRDTSSGTNSGKIFGEHFGVAIRRETMRGEKMILLAMCTSKPSLKHGSKIEIPQGTAVFTAPSNKNQRHPQFNNTTYMKLADMKWVSEKELWKSPKMTPFTSTAIAEISRHVFSQDADAVKSLKDAVNEGKLIKLGGYKLFLQAFRQSMEDVYNDVSQKPPVFKPSSAYASATAPENQQRIQAARQKFSLLVSALKKKMAVSKSASASGKGG